MKRKIIIVSIFAVAALLYTFFSFAENKKESANRCTQGELAQGLARMMPGLGLPPNATPEKCAEELFKNRNIDLRNTNAPLTSEVYDKAMCEAMGLDNQAKKLGSYKAAVQKAGATVPMSATNTLDTTAVLGTIAQPFIAGEIGKYNAIASGPAVPTPSNDKDARTVQSKAEKLTEVEVTMPPPPDNPETPPDIPPEQQPDDPQPPDEPVRPDID